MQSRRLQKAAQALLELVGTSIWRDLKEPRIENVTVINGEVAADMRRARVYVSVMGDEKQQKLCLHGLQHAAGFLQLKVAKRIDTRYTPVLKFVLDMGVKKSIEINEILHSVLPDPEKNVATEE
jgi:ribosome-binding factor A